MGQDNSSSLAGKAKYFMVAGVSGSVNTTIMFPMDTLKVRSQIANEEYGKKGERHIVNPLRLARDMLRDDGFKAFYKGYDSSIFKQFTYQGTRMGTYKYLYERGVKEHGTVSFFKKIEYAIIAAVLGAIIGNPAEITMTRRQSDLSLPPELRRNYRNVFEAIARIVKTEGFFALWKGLPYATARVIAINCSQLTTFEEVKERTRKWRGVEHDDIFSRVAAASASGLACSITALPFDNLKVKFQKMQQNPDGSWPYKTLLDCLRKTLQREGMFGFWSGFPTFFFYVTPSTLIALLTQDYIHVFFSKTAKRH
jgi:solute carrier family 25 oxoglutarate transporter 11